MYALAEVAQEGYPDCELMSPRWSCTDELDTAWDPYVPLFHSPYPTNHRSHPYFDPKSDKENPTWYMVSVKFISRLSHPPSLALIKFLAASTKMPDEVEYIGGKGYSAVKEMQLVNRGRLSESALETTRYLT